VLCAPYMTATSGTRRLRRTARPASAPPARSAFGSAVKYVDARESSAVSLAASKKKARPASAYKYASASLANKSTISSKTKTNFKKVSASYEFGGGFSDMPGTAPEGFDGWEPTGGSNGQFDAELAAAVGGGSQWDDEGEGTGEGYIGYGYTMRNQSEEEEEVDGQVEGGFYVTAENNIVDEFLA